MNVKGIFQKILAFLSFVGVFFIGLLFGKSLHDNRKRAGDDSDRKREHEEDYREAIQSADSIRDVIERVKARGGDGESEG